MSRTGLKTWRFALFKCLFWCSYLGQRFRIGQVGVFAADDEVVQESLANGGVVDEELGEDDRDVLVRSTGVEKTRYNR
jgi:hypothetical protein